MAVSAKVYTEGVVGQFGGLGDIGFAIAARRVDWLSDTIKVALMTSSYTPSQTAHGAYTADIAPYEVSGTGYTAGGAILGSKTATKSSSVVTLDAADVSWTTATITARYAAVYKVAGANGYLLGYVDFGTDQTATAGTFTITWNASGMFTYTL